MALNEQSNGFSNISQQDLESFIMNVNLGLNEEELFNLITGWVKNGYPERDTLLEHVRYQNINVDFKKNPFKWVYWKIRKSIALNPRNPNEMVLAIGGVSLTPWRHCQHIEIGANFGVLTQPWKKIKAKHNMPVKRADHGIGLVNNIMYMFGGYFHHPDDQGPDDQVAGNFWNVSRSTFAFDTIKKVSK